MGVRHRGQPHLWSWTALAHEYDLLTAFHTLSLLHFPLLHFPLPHFQRPQQNKCVSNAWRNCPMERSRSCSSAKRLFHSAGKPGYPDVLTHICNNRSPLQLMSIALNYRQYNMQFSHKMQRQRQTNSYFRYYDVFFVFWCYFHPAWDIWIFCLFYLFLI